MIGETEPVTKQFEVFAENDPGRSIPPVSNAGDDADTGVISDVLSITL